RDVLSCCARRAPKEALRSRMQRKASPERRDVRHRALLAVAPVPERIRRQRQITHVCALPRSRPCWQATQLSPWLADLLHWTQSTTSKYRAAGDECAVVP